MSQKQNKAVYRRVRPQLVIELIGVEKEYGVEMNNENYRVQLNNIFKPLDDELARSRQILAACTDGADLLIGGTADDTGDSFQTERE